jgi:hypothetical protein
MNRSGPLQALPAKPILYLLLGVVFLLASKWGPSLYPWPFFVGPADQMPAVTREFMQVNISIILLLASLYVILSSKYGPRDKHWAYGIVGTLIGYWFK